MTGQTTNDANLYSRSLPGGSLIQAIYNRQLMMWSDRGGASHHIGDRWAERCTEYVERATGGDWPIPGGSSHQLLHVLRLDELDEVSKEANNYELENPDFLLIGIDNSNGSQPVLQAADAKFAVDRIKRSQVSADAVRNLITVPEAGVTRNLLDSAIEQLGIDYPEIVRGLFICPRSTLTEFLLSQRNRGRKPKHLPDDLVDISTDPGEMFAALPMAPLIGTLARIDQLTVSPKDHLLSAIYYFRASCACFYFWREEHGPLLSDGSERIQPEAAVVAAEISYRAEEATSVFDLLFSWNGDAVQISAERKVIEAAARLPVGIQELKGFAAESGHEDDRRFTRQLRGKLEQVFRRRLIEDKGIIYADDPRSTDRISSSVSRASRNMRPELLKLAREMAFEDQQQ